MPDASINNLSNLTGISYRTIKKRLERLSPTKQTGNSIYYDTKEALPLLYAKDANGGHVENLSLEAESARLKKEQADAAEIKNAITRQELAPVKLLQDALTDVAMQINAIFDSIPLQVKKASPELTATTIETIKKELIKAKNAASRVRLDPSKKYGE